MPVVVGPVSPCRTNFTGLTQGVERRLGLRTTEFLTCENIRSAVSHLPVTDRSDGNIDQKSHTGCQRAYECGGNPSLTRVESRRQRVPNTMTSVYGTMAI